MRDGVIYNEQFVGEVDRVVKRDFALFLPFRRGRYIGDCGDFF